MRRSDFLKVGGFGLEWEPAYYEDTDLCLKLWTQCGKVMVNPNARVIHIESKTTSDSRLRLHDISEINRARFVKKWGSLARGTPELAPRRPARPPCPAQKSRNWPRQDQDLPRRQRVRPAMHSSSSTPHTNSSQVAESGCSSSWPPCCLRSLEPPTSCSPLLSATAASGSGRSKPRSVSTMCRLGLPWESWTEPELRFWCVIGNSIVPPVPAFGRRSVYHIQFPFWVPDEHVEEHGKWLAGYDEIWVVLGIRAPERQWPHPPLPAARATDPPDRPTCHLARPEANATLGRPPDPAQRGAVLYWWSQQAPGRCDRCVPSPRDRRPSRSGTRARRSHPPQPRRKEPVPRAAEAGRRAQLHLLPQHRARRFGLPVRAVRRLDPRCRIRRRSRRVPRASRTLWDHPDRSGELRLHSGRLRCRRSSRGRGQTRLRYGVHNS